MQGNHDTFNFNHNWLSGVAFLLVPVENRASAAELSAFAHELRHSGSSRLTEACRLSEQSPQMQALRIALGLRLADESVGSAV